MKNNLETQNTSEIMSPDSEKKEQKENEKMKIVIAVPGMIGKAMEKALSLTFFPGQFSMVTDMENLVSEVEGTGADVVILWGNDVKAIKAITKIRNTPEIDHQPAIITISDFRDGEDNRKKIINSGADINIDRPIEIVSGLLSNLSSVPEFIGSIEDNYSDKILKGKQFFYKQQKENLMKRSEFTADTEKELEILQEIFLKNNSKKILDAAGGSGRIAIPLSEMKNSNGEKMFDVTNCDSSLDLIQMMRENNTDINAVNGDIKNLPFKEEIYDAITYNWHIFCDILGNKAKQKVVDEAYRVLRDGGVMIFDVPDKNHYKNLESITGKKKEDMREKIFELEDDFDNEEDPLAKSIYLQGVNMARHLAGEAERMEPNYDQLKDKKIQDLPRLDFKKDGIYVHETGGNNVFVGYIPSEEEMRIFLEKAGFSDIDVKRWKTKSGFKKLTIIAKKKKAEKNQF